MNWVQSETWCDGAPYASRSQSWGCSPFFCCSDQGQLNRRSANHANIRDRANYVGALCEEIVTLLMSEESGVLARRTIL